MDDTTRGASGQSWDRGIGGPGMPKTWGDVLAALTVMLLGISGLAWGLKLEIGQSALRADLAEHLVQSVRMEEAAVEAKTKLAGHEQQYAGLVARVQLLESRVDACQLIERHGRH